MPNESTITRITQTRYDYTINDLALEETVGFDKSATPSRQSTPKNAGSTS